MKTLYLCIVIFFNVSFSSFSQITIVSGIPLPWHQTIANGQTFVLGIPLNTSVPAHDPGTNVYMIDNPVNNGCIPDYYIMRVNGFWKIGLAFYASECFSNKIAYQYHTMSNSIDPPCSGLWLRIGGAAFTSGTTPTGFLDNLILSGTSCSPGSFPIGCSTLSCQTLQLPQLSTATISALASPQQGMFTYNAYINAPTWYDGFSWKTVYNGLGDFSVGGNISTTGNATISGNLTNSGTLNSGGSIITNDDVIIKGSNQLIFQGTGPSTSYSNTIGTTTGGLDYNFTIDGNTIMNIKQSELAITGGIKTAQVSSFNSGIKYPITTSSTSTSLTSSNYMVIFTGSTANCTLPAPSSANKGQVYKIINHGSGSITFNLSITTGSSSVSTLGTNSILEMISDGFVWRKIN